MTKQQTYLDVVANSYRTGQAWRATTFLLAGVVGFLAFMLVYQVRNTPVVLVPFDLASSSKTVTVSTNGELRGTSYEYMANTALSDLSLILNFTPENVISQHQRFLNRTTEELNGQQRETLLAQADEYKRRNLTQSFFPTNVKVSSDSTSVEVYGTQIRWVGGKETLRTPINYVLTYRVFKGYMHVSDLRQKSEVAK
ncbi:type IV conjugative transfer system protein TraE [Nostoc sp. CHAB 5834]|nr:type IV conjugative transfer system protein TraE [Nostoc sp. CHAB 5834]